MLRLLAEDRVLEDLILKSFETSRPKRLRVLAEYNLIYARRPSDQSARLKSQSTSFGTGPVLIPFPMPFGSKIVSTICTYLP
jgi:hypothetical protein